MRGRGGLPGRFRWRHRHPIDDELSHHLEELERMLVSEGMSPRAARLEAERRFGDREAYATRCADVWGVGRGPEGPEHLLASMRQDISYGLRTIARAPQFTAVVVLTLALGIGANTAIFSVVHGVLMRPLGLADPDGLVVLRESSPTLGVGAAPASLPMFTDWREGLASVSSLAAWEWTSLTLQDPDEAVELQGILATGNYFTTLGVTAQLGRLFAEGDAAPGELGNVGVIGDGLWRRRFGADPNVLGKVLALDGRSVEIVGVMPPNHVAPSPEAEVWLPAGFDAATEPHPNYGARQLQIVARLRPGATVEGASREARIIAERVAEISPVTSQGWTAHAVPIRENVVGSVRSALLVAFASVGVLLLIACVNIANLLLARSAAREREVAIRTALGAGRGRITRQLLTESVLLSLLGGVAGIAVAFGAHRAILALEPGVLPRVQEIRLDPAVLGFALALSALTGVVFGLVPSIQATSAHLTGVMKRAPGRGSTGSGDDRLRRLLVAGQMALTLVLLAGAGLLSRTFIELRAVDPGFEPEGLVAARIFLDDPRYRTQEERHLYYAGLLDRLSALPGVTSVGASSSLPMDPVSVNFDLPFRTEATAGTEGGDVPQADFRVVTPGYFETLGVELLEGRFFSDADGPESPPVVLVNRAMAERHWPDRSPVGRRLETVFQGWQWYEIVGVVENTRYYGPDSEPRPEMYVAEPQSTFFSMTVTARTAGDAAALVPQVRTAFRDVDPLRPPQSVFQVHDLVRASVAAERFYATLLGAFALVAMLLASAGVYGVLSYRVSQRSQEIGVRLALGAGRSRVLALIVASGMAVAGSGIALGLVGVVVTTRFLSGMLFGVRALDPLTLGVVVLTLALAALAACLVPGYRASRLDPVRTLRQE